MLLDLLLTTLLVVGIFLWFPLVRADAFWAQLEGPSLFGLSLALALMPALLVDRLTFPLFDAVIERSGELAAHRGGGPDNLTAVAVQLRPFRSRRGRRATTFLVFFNLLASSSSLALDDDVRQRAHAAPPARARSRMAAPRELCHL